MSVKRRKLLIHYLQCRQKTLHHNPLFCARQNTLTKKHFDQLCFHHLNTRFPLQIVQRYHFCSLPLSTSFSSFNYYDSSFQPPLQNYKASQHQLSYLQTKDYFHRYFLKSEYFYLFPLRNNLLFT